MNVLEKIAYELKLDVTYVSRVAERSAFYYKDFTIPKHDGSVRYIAQPSPELKTLQYWVVHNILNKLPVSESAYAYKKGDSIKKHARTHRYSNFLLHTDIYNFFPSVRPYMLNNVLRQNRDIFNQLGLDLEPSIRDIEKICFRNGELCVGAVSSPAISNVVMNAFDLEMIEYCSTNGYLYSRYADDIYISSKYYINKEILSLLQEKLNKYRFKINQKKTRFSSVKNRRKVTGLIITTDSQVSIGTEKRKLIRKMVYDKLIHGRGDSNQILGYLSFLKDIEPHTYNNIIIKYSQYCNGDLIEELRK